MARPIPAKYGVFPHILALPMSWRNFVISDYRIDQAESADGGVVEYYI